MAVYMLFFTTERQVFLNPYHFIGEDQLAVGGSSGTLKMIAGQGPQRQPVLEQHARRVPCPSR